ncbi:MAG: hypothetical protein RL684_1238 [Pseudomonadota bacterium]|jgi:predicted nucleic acid-binding protein
MTRRRIYLDSCVLIAAFKAKEPEISDAALQLLDDSEIELLYSPITELETMPKPAFHKQTAECEFYRTVFEAGTRVACTEGTINDALERALRNGLGACDALHLACAISAGAEEFITSEKGTRLPSAPDPGIAIRTLRPSRGAVDG